MGIKIIDRKLKIVVNDDELVEVVFNNLVDNIRFEMQWNMLIGNVSWSRFDYPSEVLNPSSSYEIINGNMELKLVKIASIPVKSFNSRLDLEFLCAYLVEIGQNMNQKLNYNEFFRQAFDVVLAKKTSRNSSKNSVMATFQYLLKLAPTPIDRLPELPAI